MEIDIAHGLQAFSILFLLGTIVALVWRDRRVARRGGHAAPGDDA